MKGGQDLVSVYAIAQAIGTSPATVTTILRKAERKFEVRLRARGYRLEDLIDLPTNKPEGEHHVTATHQ